MDANTIHRELIEKGVKVAAWKNTRGIYGADAVWTDVGEGRPDLRTAYGAGSSLDEAMENLQKDYSAQQG